MSEQKLSKQIAREYYNVIYGAKLNFSSLDICEKLPGIIGFLSLAIGVLGLSFENFNNKILATALLIAGIIGLMLKPKELNKDKYLESGKKLTDLSKKLELLHARSLESEYDANLIRTELEDLQTKHYEIETTQPVFLSSWYAHYKLFSEHNNKWFCEELSLTFWRDKLPLSFRLTLIFVFLMVLIISNPLCILSENFEFLSSLSCCR